MRLSRQAEKGSFKWITMASLAFAVVLASPALKAQSGTQGQQPSTGAQDIPDAPSTVQPPVPKPPAPMPDPVPDSPSSSSKPQTQPTDEPKPAPPPMPPIETVPAGSVPETSSRRSAPRNQIDPAQDLYKISVPVNFVQIPVLVKDKTGRRVDGLLPKDFTVLENGKPQKLTYFTSDPFQLSVAIVLDNGMADIALQKVNETYSALAGAFSPYDEFALYTYSSTVSQASGFTGKPARLTAQLNQMKTVRGHENGPPMLSGPLAAGPTVNGYPVGGPPVAPSIAPPKEAHVLNDAILRAALDLNKRDRTRRRLILVISDGRERGSQASYKDVLRLLETYGIQVRAVVVDSGALPGFRQVGKLHLPGQGYSNILPKYVNATGGGEDNPELTRNSIEDAYSLITSEARNQYTLGYSPKAIGGASAYRTLVVEVDKSGLNIFTKAGYYPIAAAH
ncbi:MAG: VWA domain-containing protein [Candidatus Sulfotelmatobacter sp.]